MKLLKLFHINKNLHGLNCVSNCNSHSLPHNVPQFSLRAQPNIIQQRSSVDFLVWKWKKKKYDNLKQIYGAVVHS